MTPSPTSRAIIAAAGAKKTQLIVDEILNTSKRILVTTYTTENQSQIERRLSEDIGIMPAHVTSKTWFSFLLNDCVRPYQRAVLGQPNVLVGLNFVGQRSRFTPRAKPMAFYLDAGRNAYRDGLSDLACQLEEATGGWVTGRIKDLFGRVYIDEIQDMAGYDLELLDLMMKAGISLTMVGDPRQHTFSTNQGRKNKSKKGVGLVGWLEDRPQLCAVEHRAESYRCNQAICDFADALYPDLNPTTSLNDEVTGHDGIFQIKPSEVKAYMAGWSPTILRWDVRTNTLGLPAMNIGASKGSTFDRVLIFPTKPMLTYLKSRDRSKLKSPEKFYVAVTRARFSVAFVVP